MRRVLQGILTVLLICTCTWVSAQSSQVVNNGQQTQPVIFSGAGCAYTWTNDKPGIGLAASGIGDIPAFTAVNNGSTAVTATIKVTPVLASYAYIANQGSNTVTVIDGSSHSVIGTIGIGATPVGITASPDGNRVYIANNVTNDVSVINTADNSLIINIPVGLNPFAITISPDSKWVYVSNQNDASISVINTQSNSVVASINNVASVTSICASPDGKWVYAATEASPHFVYVIDALTNTIASSIPISTAQNVGMVITPDGKNLYFTNNLDNSVTVINLATKAISTISIGFRPDISFNSGPYGIAINSTGTRVYAICSYQNEIDIINTATNTVIKTIPVTGGEVFTVSVSSDDKELYVTNRNANEIEVYSTATYSKITTITDPGFSSPFSSGSFISKGPGCNAAPFTFTITVKSSVPELVAPIAATGRISACAGSPSASPNIQQFTLSGVALTAGVTVQAPAKFEISLNQATGYASSLSLNPSAGKLNSTIIYVRSSQTASGVISGNVKITSTGAATVLVAVKGKVNALPTVNTVANQTVNAGALTQAINFTGTANTFKWINDNPSIGLPASGSGDIAAFTALNSTQSQILANITVTPLSAGYAYVANQTSNDVSVINTSTNEVVMTIPVGKGPIGAVVSPDGSHIYVINLIDRTVSVISTATNTVTATVPVGDSPYGIGISPDGSYVYVANMNVNSISVINTATNNVTTLFGIDHPYDVVTSPDGAKLYVTGYQASKLFVVNAVTGNIDAAVTVGAFPSELTVSPDGSRIYVSNYGENTVSVIDAATNTLLKTVTVGLSPVGIAVSADGKKVFVANGANSTVSVFDAQSFSILASIPVGNTPNGVSFNSEGFLYVANAQSSTMSVIDPATYQVIATIPTGKNPTSVGSFITTGASCTGAPTKLNIKVNASPAAITAGPVTGSISACAGSPSANPNIQQLTVAGTGLTNDITATAPVNFEVSLSASSGFGNTVTLTQSGGKVTNVLVYVRSAASVAAGPVSGKVTLSSAGATNVTAAVSGTVNALPVVDAVDNKTYVNGDVTSLIKFTGTGNTFTWTNDNPAIGLAASGEGDIASFTAVNNTSAPIQGKVTVLPLSKGFAYIANGQDGTVSVINTETGKVVSTITVEENPTFVSVSPNGKLVYVVNNSSHSVSIINTTSNKVTGTIAVGWPAQAKVSNDGSLLYVADYKANAVIAYNTTTHAVSKSIPVGEEPFGIALSPDGSRLYCANTTPGNVSVVNLATSKVIATVPVGSSPGRLIVSNDGAQLLVSNYLSNSISIINTATNTVSSVITTPANPADMTLSIDGRYLYVADYGAASVSVIDINAKSIIATIPVGTNPVGISVEPNDGTIYVVNQGSGNVSVINSVTNTVISTIKVGAVPNSPGNFITRGTGCEGNTITFTITVNTNSPVAITPGPVTGNITACAGLPSASPDIQQFTVSGSGLTNNITATAPAKFEISLSANSGFGGAVTLKQVGGAVTNAIVYVRSAVSARGAVSGDVTLSSPGIADVKVTVNGFVNELPTADKIQDKVFTNGDNAGPIPFTGTGNVFTWTNDNPTIGLAASGEGDIASFTAVNNSGAPVKANVTVFPSSKGFAYIANGQDGTVSVINTGTGKVVATITVGQNPTYVSVSPDGKLVYVVNNSSNSISVINTSSNKVTGTIPVGSPNQVKVSNDGSLLYLADYTANAVIAYNATTYAVSKTIPVGTGPGGIALSPDGSKIYVANITSGNVSVVNIASGTVTATIQVGSNPNHILVSKDGSRVFVSNFFSNSVSVINTSTNSVISSINTLANPDAMALSLDGHYLYVANYGAASISVIDVNTNGTITTIPVGTNPAGVSVDPSDGSVYVVNQGLGNVSVINSSTNKVVSAITVGAMPNSPGNFITRGTGCIGTPVTFAITVNANNQAVITHGAVTGNIVACAGTPSASPNIQQFAVSGTGLSGDITVTAPTGFEVSILANSGFAKTATLTRTNGSVTNVVVYVRSATDAIGIISDNVSLTSPGATTQTVAVRAFADALPTVNAISSQTKRDGENTDAINFSGTGNQFNWVNDKPEIGLPASGTGNIASFVAINKGGSPVVANITVTPSAKGFAYIPNTQSNNVSIISLADNTVIGTLNIGKNPYSVAVNKIDNTVYISNSGDNTVSIINVATNTVSGTITVGTSPYGIKLSPDGSLLYVANFGSNDVSVISTSTNSVVKTIAGFIGPADVAISPDGGTIYVSNGNSNTVSVVNAASNNITGTVQVGVSPYMMRMSPDGSRLYVANDASQDISVINTATNTLVTSITGNFSPYGLGLSPDGSTLYVPNLSSGNISIVNTVTNAIIAVVGGFGGPTGISFSSDGKYYYVANQLNKALSVVDAKTNVILGNITVGDDPIAMGNFLFPGSTCDGDPVTFTITVNPATPAITHGPATGIIVACAGSPSRSPNIQQFTVSGNSLTGNITASAAIGFEVSVTPNGGYAKSVTIAQQNGNVTGAIVYVRSADYAIGSISGNIELASPGFTSVEVPVRALVDDLPTVNAISSQIKQDGDMTDLVKFAGTGNQFRWANDKPEIGLPAAGLGDIASFKAINAGTTDITATITVTPLKLGYAYIPALQDNKVSVVSLATNSVIAYLPVGNHPIGVTVNTKNNLIYVTNADGSTVSVIDPADNTVKAPIEVGNSPYGIKSNADGSLLFVASLNGNKVSVIDISTNTVIRTMDSFTGPIDVAVSADGSTLYVSNNKSTTVSVISLANYTVQKTITVGNGPYGLCFSPDGTRLYVANEYSRDISVINTATNTVSSTIEGNFGPLYLGISPDGSRLYIPNVNATNVSVVNTATNAVVATIEGFAQPTGITVSPDGKFIYVTSQGDNKLSVIDAETNTVLREITVGKDPAAIGNFLTPGAGCDGQPITFTIKVKATVPPVISTAGQLSPVNTIYGTSSAATTFTISGTSMREGIKVTPPAGIEISIDNVNFSTTLTVGAAGTIASTPVYVRLAKTTPVGSYDGFITLESTAATTIQVVLPTCVVSPAALTVTANNKSKDYGAALTGLSGSTEFTVNNLQNSETAGSVTLVYGNGAAATDPVGNYPRSVTPSALTGGTFDPKNYGTPVYISGDITINKTPLTITADNKTKTYKDPNPALTITYKGFVNNESPAQLTSLPVISTTADETSAPGSYPILISGAAALNYNIAFVNGVLTVVGLKVPLKIPNTFTPNGDGINDTWAIGNIDNYPGCTVNIYNRWGQSVFSSIGYGKLWDGSYKGALLPVSTYYYIIDVKNGSQAYSGSITIIR